MRKRTTRAVWLAAALHLLVAAPAMAQDAAPPPADQTRTQLDFGTATTDPQATHLTLPVTCTAPATAQTACAVHVALSWQRTPSGKWDPSGPAVPILATDVTIGAGATQTLAFDVPPSKLRDVLVRERTTAIVSFAFSDAAGDLGGPGVYVTPYIVNSGCGGPAFVRVVSGSLDEDVHRFADGPKAIWQHLFSPDIGGSGRYRVTSATASVTFDGVRWDLTKGSIFNYTCAALSDYFARRAFPTILLESGRVHAVGTPHGALRAVTVSTAEGNLGMRRAEATDLTVTRDPARSRSTMRVARGDSGQITTTYKGVHNGVRNSPCTNGHALSVDRYGVIKKL